MTPTTLLRIAQAVDMSIWQMNHRIVNGEKMSFTLTNQERLVNKGQPTASSLGLCPRKAAFRRLSEAPTHAEENRTLNHLLSQGIVAGAYALEAIKSAKTIKDENVFLNIQAELPVQGDGYTGTCDIVAVHHGELMDNIESGMALDSADRLAKFVVEVKQTSNMQLQRRYAYQTIAYMMATDSPWGVVLMINRFDWSVYAIEPANAGWMIYKLYNYELVHGHPDNQYVSIDDFWDEVGEQAGHLELAELYGVPPLQSPPLVMDQVSNKVEGHRWECVDITSQPIRYKTKRTYEGKTYEIGDVRRGKGKCRCPYIGKCFPQMLNRTEFEIDLIKTPQDGDEVPMIAYEEEPF